MIKEAIYHKIDSDYCYALSKQQLLVKIRTKKDDVNIIKLIYMDKYKYGKTGESFSVHMKKVATDILFDYYETIIDLKMIYVWYYFELQYKNEKVNYGNYKFFHETPKDGSYVFSMPKSSEKDVFTVPQWATKSIVYQIFIERFCNGDKRLDPKDVQDWYSEVTLDSMLGGDLKGIIKKLDYIEDLGINTIYLTPIFRADSNHKYNTYDYFQIDPQFGKLEDLKELVKKAHERNIKVILDAVFNHCGVNFHPFKDVLEKGEYSEYKHWFDISKFPVKIKNDPNYATFGYYGYMPKLMTKNRKVKDYLINVATYWIKEVNIDGWRLDVADEIDHSFWRDFRIAVKEIKKDALIIGEVWYDSTSWLKGDQFDTVMNYEFQSAIADFISEETITAKQFGERMGFLRGLYKLPAYNTLWNLIDSHDTPRFLHSADENLDKLKVAVLLQLTLPGVPMIYYGDEVGMTGGVDPDCRRGMLWEESRQNTSLRQYYKKLIKLRKENNALSSGDFITLFHFENVYGFRREYDDEIIDVYINSGNSDFLLEVKSENNLINLLHGEYYVPSNGIVKILLKEKKAVILKKL